MADDSDTPAAPALPPKLNLRKQGILKRDPAVMPDTALKHETSRLVVDPAPEPVAPAEPAAPASAPVAASAEKTPSIRLQPLKPKPVVIAPPVAVAAPAPPPAVTEADSLRTDAKRKTSRIPLGAAKPASDNAVVKLDPLKPRTIKIKPSVPLSKIRSTQPLSITVPMADGPDDAVDSDAGKRKTSRIPLEEALTADKVADDGQEASDPARPKTIKIKRPGSTEAATVKMQRPPAAGGGAPMGETARLDHLPLDLAEDTPTQKKTIRVKRPAAGGSGGSAISVAKTAAPVGLGLVPPEPFEDESDEPGVAWALLGIAATLVLGVVIYMLAAQAVGPNLSGTQLSSWKDGPALTWPGKILN